MTELTNATQNADRYAVALASRQRKSLLGQKMCRQFLEIFVDDNNDKPRRWVFEETALMFFILLRMTEWAILTRTDTKIQRQ